MANESNENDLRWHDATDLTIEGKAWTDAEFIYHRLPARAKAFVNERFWKLSRCPAGMSVHFSTNAPTLFVRWDGPADPAGYSGVDLYVRHDGNWKWLSVGTASGGVTEKRMFDGIPVENRDYMLYLPLFHQVQRVEIGVPAECELEATEPRTGKPVVFYGTSITHGSRASRAGMCYSAILGRWLDHPILNLGFSGNGDMDPRVIDLLCELDPAVYVLDCLPNLIAPQVEERAEPAVRKLRAARPETPIVLVEMAYCDMFLKPDRRERCENSNKAQRAVYEKLVRDGVENLRYVEGDDLIGTDGDATIDGTHYTDVGYMRYSRKLFGVLRDLIGG